MADEPKRDTEPQGIRTVKPGDRVLRVRTHRRRLPRIERGVGGPLMAAVGLFRDIFANTPILPIMTTLTLLVFLAPIPVFFLERGAADSQVSSYWVALWWAVSAMSTAGHSDVVLVTGAGRTVGSIYTVLAVGLFFGSVLAAFSSYFMLTWRRPKQMFTDTATYYLQRVDELTVEELDDLADITHGLIRTAKERAEEEGRRSEPQPDDASSPE